MSQWLAVGRTLVVYYLQGHCLVMDDRQWHCVCVEMPQPQPRGFPDTRITPLPPLRVHHGNKKMAGRRAGRTESVGSDSAALAGGLGSGWCVA
jgi:hypothetical protein